VPQGERNPEEYRDFKKMLGNMDILFLGARVIVLLDLIYVSRFWTQFEFWLSIQDGTPTGLRSSRNPENRCEIRCLHNAVAGNHDKSLMSRWMDMTPAQAHDFLKKGDVEVTNQGDKDTQLPLIKQLDDQVRFMYEQFLSNVEGRDQARRDAQGERLALERAAQAVASAFWEKQQTVNLRLQPKPSYENLPPTCRQWSGEASIKEPRSQSDRDAVPAALGASDRETSHHSKARSTSVITSVSHALVRALEDTSPRPRSALRSWKRALTRHQLNRVPS